MLYFVLGVEYTTEEGTRIIPITRDLFNPDLQVMNQKIVRYLFPDATPGFINSVIESNSLSPLKLYPLVSSAGISIPTNIHPAFEFALFSRIAQGTSPVKDSSTIDVISDLIKEVISNGWNIVVKKHQSISSTVKVRHINVEENQDTDILMFHVAFATLRKKNFIVKLFDKTTKFDGFDEAIRDSVIYFNTTSLPNDAKLSYELECGFMNLKTQEFEELCEYLPTNDMILTQNVLDRKIIRATQYKPEILIGNIVDAGIEKIKLRLEKSLLLALKTYKFKG